MPRSSLQPKRRRCSTGARRPARLSLPNNRGAYGCRRSSHSYSRQPDNAGRSPPEKEAFSRSLQISATNGAAFVSAAGIVYSRQEPIGTLLSRLLTLLNWYTADELRDVVLPLEAARHV